MDVVWRLGEVTAEQVRAALPGAPHDSTVRTLMRVLENKGYLTHEVRGKVYVHRALVGRQKAQKLAVRTVLARFFAGSAEDLVLRLIEDEQLTREQLDELRKVPDCAYRSKTSKERRAVMNPASGASWSSMTFALGLDVAAKATAILVIVLLIQFVLGRRRALLGSAVGNAGLIGLLLLPVSAMVFPSLPIACLPARVSESAGRSGGGCLANWLRSARLARRRRTRS